MAHSDDGQYELVLENKQVLGIFFVAAALCGIFFGLGFLVGRSSKGPTGATQQVTATGSASDNRKSAMPSEKPPATSGVAAPTADTSADSGAAADKPADPPVASEKEKEKPKPEEKPPASASPPAPEDSGAVNVQVAAFSTRDEAEPVAALLKRKNFPVSIVAGTTDKLQHVLVGPYSNVKEADAVKKKLEGEGFKPIVKK